MHRNHSVEFSPLKVDTLELPSVLRNTNRRPSKSGSGKFLSNLCTEEIKDFLKKEKEKTKSKKYITKNSRDISYIKDRLKPIDLPVIPPLPTDINHLKKLMESSNWNGVPISFSPQGKPQHILCKKETCVDYALEKHPRSGCVSSMDFYEVQNPQTIENIERGYLGNPSGRQEIDHLRKWFFHMISNYGSFEDLNAVYSMCGKELIRQISVHCIERGELLKELLMKFPELFSLQEKEWESKLKAKEESLMNEIKEIKEKYDKEIRKRNEKIDELKNLIEKSEDKTLKLSVDALLMKKRWKEALKKLMQEREEYKKKNSNSEVIIRKPNIKRTIKEPQRIEISTVNWKNEEIKLEQSQNTIQFTELSGFMHESAENIKDVLQTQDESQRKIDEEIAQEIDGDYIENNEYLQEENHSQPELEGDNKSQHEVEEEPSNNQQDLEGVEDFNETENKIENEDKFSNKDSDYREINDNVWEIQKQLSIEIQCKPKEEKTIENHESYAMIEMNNANIGIQTDYEETNATLEASNPRTSQAPLLNLLSQLDLSRTPSKVSKKNQKGHEAHQKSNQNSKKREKKTPIKGQSGEIDSFEGKIFITSDKNESEEFKIIKEADAVDEIETYGSNSNNASPTKQLKDTENTQNSFILTETIENQLTSRSQEDLEDPKRTKYRTNKRRKTAVVKDETSPIKLKHKRPSKLKGASARSTNAPNDIDIEIIKKLQILQKLNEEIQKKEKELERDSSSSRSAQPDSRRKGKLSSQRSNEDLVVDDDEISKLIPADLDKPSWIIGYHVGYEKGKTVGFIEGENFGVEEGQLEGYLQAIKENKNASNIHSENVSSDEEADEELKDEYFSDSDGSKTDIKVEYSPTRKQTGFAAIAQKVIKKRRELTKVMEFQFHKRSINLAQKKTNPALSILCKFMAKKIEYMKKKSTMSRKMVNRLITSIYESAIQKLRDDEIIENLAELAYDQFFSKYGIKAPSYKKFIDFIASLICTKEWRRSYIFLKFLQCGHKIGTTDYSKPSLFLYLSCLEYMLTSKLGIISGYQDTSDVNMFPALRATECLKENFEYIDKSVYTSILSRMEKTISIDPKRINGAGLIELETFLEIVVEEYENYQRQIHDGISMILKALKCNIKKPLSKPLLFIVIRQIIGNKLNIPIKDEDFSIEDFSVKNRYRSIISLLQSDSIDAEDLNIASIESNVFKINEVKEKYNLNYEISVEKAKEMIEKEKPEVLMIIEKMKNVREKKWKSLDEEEWSWRITDCESGLEISKDIQTLILAWKIYWLELERINENYLSQI